MSLEKPKKPYPEFPLFAHARGKWAKKIDGEIKYFGRWEDPEGALAEYKAWLASLDRPVINQEIGLSVKMAFNLYLTQRKKDVDAGKLAVRTFTDYKRTLTAFVKFLGMNRVVESLTPEDFSRYINDVSSRTNPVNSGNEATRIKSAFKWLIQQKKVSEVDYGPDFKKPSRKAVRKYRRKRGTMLYSPEELHSILNESGKRVRAMILLGINCGYQNDDIEWLPLANAEKALQKMIIELPREKTEVERGCPLWEETATAIREWMEIRPETDSDRLFCRHDGKPFSPVNAEVAKQFRSMRDLAGIRRGGFSWLRKTFATYASECGDQIAVDAIMGHVDDSIPGLYRQLLREKRLHKATDAVHTWLFGTPAHLKEGSTEQGS